MADEGETGEDETEADSPVIKALMAENKELALRAQIAASRRALAGLGLSDLKTREGEFRIEGETPIEGVILAHRALEKVAGEIARRVAEAGPTPPSRVFLHDATIFKGLSGLAGLRGQLALLEGEAGALLRELGPRDGLESLALPIVGGVIASAVELLSLFRKDVAVSDGKLEPTDRALAVAVAGALNARNVEVIDSAMVPVGPAGGPKDSALCARLEALQTTRSSLAAQGRALESTRKARETTEEATPREAAQEAAIAAMVATLGTFLDALLTVDETTGATRLAQMLDAETIEARIDATTAFLWLKVEAAGGGSRVTKSLVSGSVDYSGGAIASFALYGCDGALRAAGTVPRYTGFVTLSATTPPEDLLPAW